MTLLLVLMAAGLLVFSYRLGKASKTLDGLTRHHSSEVIDLEQRRQLRALKAAVERHPVGRAR